MHQKEESDTTEQQFLDEAKRQKSTAIINAVLIGFLIGIIIYSIVKNNVGLFTLIPLYFLFKLVNSNKRKKL